MGTFFLFIFILLILLLLLGFIMRAIPHFKSTLKNISILFSSHKEDKAKDNKDITITVSSHRSRHKNEDPINYTITDSSHNIMTPILTQNNLTTLNFTAIDFETANENPASACSIGLVIVENGTIVDKKEYFIKPTVGEFRPINVSIHGITENNVKDSPTFSNLWDNIKHHIENQIIIAHNASFDINVLLSTLEYYNINVPNFKYACTQKLAQQAFTDLKNYRLNDVADFLNLNHIHHNSLSDAVIAAEIGIRAIPNIKTSIFNLKEDEITCNISKIASQDKTDNLTTLSSKKKLNSKLLKPNLESADPNSYFYNKKVVFTGDLESISRKEAAEIIYEMGADINTNVSKKTHIVILGHNPGPSKLKQIEVINSEEEIIQIMTEEEFLIKIKR